jgi:hypothetical protein
VVALSTLIRAVISLGVPSAWILPDEDVYAELAKSIAAGNFPSIRGEHELGWGVVYQALIAPAWALLESPVHAYHASLLINSLVMSLAAVPAYLLARMFVPAGLSVVVSAMTVLVPSMTYTGVVMTENACYPAFLLAVLLIARAVRSPSLANQGIALVGLGIVALTRIQAIALVGAYVGAALMYAALTPGHARPRYLRRFVPTAALALAVSLAPIAVSLARGDRALAWLGARSNTFDGFHAREVPQWFAFLVGDLILYVAVAPAAATAVMVVRGISREVPVHLRLFAAMALPTLVAMLSSVSFVSAALDVDGTENLNERYVFYVVPLMFVGLALWIAEGQPRPGRWPLVSVLLSCLICATLPIPRLTHNANFQSPGLLPLFAIERSHLVVALAVTGFTAVCGALWMSLRRDRVGYLWLMTSAVMAVAAVSAGISAANSAAGAASAFDGRRADWVDRAVPRRAEVVVLWYQGSETRLQTLDAWVMVTEFFNRSIGDVYRIGRPTYYDEFLPTVPVAVDDDGVVTFRGKPVVNRFVLTTCKTPIDGRPIAAAPSAWLQLVEVNGVVRLTGRPRCKTGVW